MKVFEYISWRYIFNVDICSKWNVDADEVKDIFRNRQTLPKIFHSCVFSQMCEIVYINIGHIASKFIRLELGLTWTLQFSHSLFLGRKKNFYNWKEKKKPQKSNSVLRWNLFVSLWMIKILELQTEDYHGQMSLNNFFFLWWI